MSMRPGFLATFLVAITAIYAEPIVECQAGIMYIADLEDLCSFHWCVGENNSPIKWRCPPGARVPTWFESAPEDAQIPCIMDHSTDVTCLRCNFGPDERIRPPPDSCENNPCPPECTCENLWANEFHCICPGDVVPSFVPDDFRPVDYCDPNNCVNGGVCHSQWDTYWCQCPNGYTGKNCEVPFCEPNPCMNGGTCTIDNHNYRCECTACFGGSCCNETLANCQPAVACQDPCEFGDSCQFRRKDLCSCNPCKDSSACTDGADGQDRQCAKVCDSCSFGDNCEFTRNHLCSCNPCPDQQTCVDGQNNQDRICNSNKDDPCEGQRHSLCSCNPCPLDSQICFNGINNANRRCLGKPGPYGSMYTLTFSEDAGSGSSYRRVYISTAGERINQGFSNRVRIYTPGITTGKCAVDKEVTVSLDKPFFFDVPEGCLNTVGQQENQVLRVVELDGQEIVVTVTNADGDGYLAIPDAYAGQHFVTHTFSASGALQYITAVALEDNTEVLIKVPAKESFAINEGEDASSDIVKFNLNSLGSFRYQIAGDLSAAVIVSNKNIHIWSGNNDASSQKTQEMLLNVKRWGANSDKYNYVISSASGREINLVDIITIESAVPTQYNLTLIRPGDDLSISGMVNGFASLGSLKTGEMYHLSTSQPVQVTHHIRGANSDSVNFHSAYTLIPAVENYAGSYSFQVHGQRDGVGGDYSENVLIIISPRNIIADAPASMEDIMIYRYDPLTNTNSTYTVSELGGRFVKAFLFYNVARVILPGPGMYYLSNPSLDSWRFGAIYYGLTKVSGGRRSLQPNTAFPLGYDMTQLNDIAVPVLCDRCKTGANCQLDIISTCACNACPNFDDVCEDSPNPTDQRICTDGQTSTGNPFHLMFMQNRPDDTEKRELEIYVTSAGRSSREIRVYTPYIDPSDNCHLDIKRSVPGLTVSQFILPKPGCYETIGAGTFNNKVIRVESLDDQNLLVYAVNRDEWSADGWVALPDAGAGMDYYVIAHAPPRYGTQFAVLATENTNVIITYTGRAAPSDGLNTTLFNLAAGQVLQIQSKDDLSGTRVQSDKPVNVYSGNIRALVVKVENPQVGNINSGSRDHLVEQLIPTSRWGLQFNVEPIPNRRFGDQLKVVASEDGTDVVMARRSPEGQVTQERFSLNSGEIFTRDVISANTYRVTSNKKIFVAQITKSAERNSFHDPSLLTVPPIEQYSNRYVFSTPEFSGGDGTKRPYNTTLVLISARNKDKDGIYIYNSNTPGVSVTDLATDDNPWRPVPGTDYSNIAVKIAFGTNLIVHRDPSVSFMCLFYGFDDRESLGFPVGMKLQILN